MTSASQRLNEASPLLPDRSPSASPSPTRSVTQRAVAQLRRSRFVLIPLLLVAIAGILWGFSEPTSNDAGGEGSASATTRASGPTATLSDSELLTLLPPFTRKRHAIPPRLINRTAFPMAIPTNAFWTNLLVGDDHGLNVGAGPVTLSPYTVRSLPKRLEISYGDSRRVVTRDAVTEYFHVDVGLTGYSREVTPTASEPDDATHRLLGDGNSTSRHVAAFDPLSVTVEYRFENESDAVTQTPRQGMRVPLVRGSPFVTVEYTQLLPVIELNATALLAVNGESMGSEQDCDGLQWTSSRFVIDMEVYGAAQADGNATGVARQRWVLYFAQERTLRLQAAQEKDYRSYNQRGELTTPTSLRFVDSALYSGVLRVALVPNGSEAALRVLDEGAAVYPTGASVTTQVEALQAQITMCWNVSAMHAGKKEEEGEEKAKVVVDADALLMMAHPHHVDMFFWSDTAGFKLLSGEVLPYRTVKSFMTPVRGSCWTLVEQLPDVGFGYDGINGSNSSENNENRATTNVTPSALLAVVNTDVVPPEFLEEIQTALRNDSAYEPEATDPYYFGKEISRQARLVLIADTLQDTETRDTLLDKLENWIAPWLTAENDNEFVYDAAWGGLCSKNGLMGIFYMADFGNGWYNDHHFHYGYFLYSVAVVAKYRPEFAATHKAAILALVRDIASFDADDQYFPSTRHFSWFDGHSFASGVYTLDGGKSQESVSEAINAYYGVFLLGHALGIPTLEHTGHILVALEARAARTYWQMTASSSIYEPEYAQNKMTGQVAATKVSYTTWFGPQTEHIHLINMIPFTPITEAFVSPAYVSEEYPVLVERAFKRTINPIDRRWSGYAYLDLAIIDPRAAWDQVLALDFFDDGNSRTNSLFWIATRPSVSQ